MRRWPRFADLFATVWATYASDRNHPEIDGTSQLSPYLHFGQIGPHTVALAIRDAAAPPRSRRVSRRADRAARAGSEFRALQSALQVARERRAVGASHAREHARDPRAHISIRKSNSRTPRRTTFCGMPHSGRWSAAGWMHGYMRMYWAKKILEWSPFRGGSIRYLCEAERPLRTRRARSQRLRRHRMGDWRQARPRVGSRAAGLRQNPLHVVRQHFAQVRQPRVYRTMERVSAGESALRQRRADQNRRLVMPARRRGALRRRSQAQRFSH